MGADLYIECKEADEYDARLKSLVESAIATRNALITLHGADRDRKTLKFLNSEVQSAQDEVDALDDQRWSKNPHYFRDPYNDSSILWRLGLSWWQDVGKMLDEQFEGQPKLKDDDDEGWNARSILTPENCLRLLKMVKERAKHLEAIDRAWLEEHNCATKGEGNSPEEWNRYYAEKLAKLIAFLKRGAKAGGIYCSI